MQPKKDRVALLVSHFHQVLDLGITLTGFTPGQPVNLRVKTANPAGNTYGAVKAVTTLCDGRAGAQRVVNGKALLRKAPSH